MTKRLKITVSLILVSIILYVITCFTPLNLITSTLLEITNDAKTPKNEGVAFANEMNVDFEKEGVYLIKEAYACGDNDLCTEGCAIGYFYMSDEYSEKEAMEKLDLGERNGIKYFHPRYDGAKGEYIIAGSQSYGKGKIVEFHLTGTC